MSFARGAVRRALKRILLRLETRVNTIIVYFQIGASDGPVLAICSISNEPFFVFAEQDIRVNEGTAADSAREYGTKCFERQDFEEAE
jgi:hypothetical protein